MTRARSWMAFKAVAVAAVAICCALAATPTADADDDRPLPVHYNFLLGMITGSLAENPPGANDWACRPSQAHPRPVVLVHGTFLSQSNNWQTLSPVLKNAGYCVYALTYGALSLGPPQARIGGLAPMEDSARELKRFVNRVLMSTGATKVDLVGHSQGTVMPNYYVKFLGGDRTVRNYISLAPAWHGTQLLQPPGALFTALGGREADLPICHACGQLRPESDFLRHLGRGGMAVPGIRYLNLMTRYDEVVVPYTSGIEEGMRNIVVQDRCASDYSEHGEIAADPVAIDLVLSTIDPQRLPDSSSCALVLPGLGPLAGAV